MDNYLPEQLPVPSATTLHYSTLHMWLLNLFPPFYSIPYPLSSCRILSHTTFLEPDSPLPSITYADTFLASRQGDISHSPWILGSWIIWRVSDSDFDPAFNQQNILTSVDYAMCAMNWSLMGPRETII